MRFFLAFLTKKIVMRLAVIFFLLFPFSFGFSASLNDYEKVKYRFDRMYQNSPLKIEFTELIYTQIYRYLRELDMPKVMAVFHFYTPLFDAKLEHYGAPTTLKYITLIESRLNTNTVSTAGAIGMWQVMPQTGEELHLRKDQYINDWLNPVATTDAISRYLANSFKRLNDWNLAVVSYNCGVGGVNKAIRKAGTKNVWTVWKFLPKETRDYLVRFHAMHYVDRYGYLHGFHPKEMKYNFSQTKVIFYDGKTPIRRDKWFYFMNTHILTDYIPIGAPVIVFR